MSQHDMNIANNSGLGFRNDLNLALAALVSNSSGATAPTTTFAYQFWTDTSGGSPILKIRNGANTAWVSLGAVDTGFAPSIITNSTMANMAANTIKGNNTGSSASPSDLTVPQATAMLNPFVGDSGSGGTKGLVPAPGTGDAAAGKFLKADGTFAVPSAAGVSALTGDVTASGTGSVPATIANDAVTNAKMANMATQTIKGRTTASTGDPEDLTVTQATAMLNAFVGDSGSGGTKGLVPAPGAGAAAAAKFLKADGTWAITPGAGALSVVTKASSYAATSSDDIILCNAVSAGFTVTLPSASSNTGKVLTLIKSDTTLNPVTISGPGKTLNTLNELRRFVSDGTNWVQIDWEAETDFVSDGTITIGATTTAPTKGTTTRDAVYWMRRKQMLYCRYVFAQSSAGSTGNGNYLFSLPAGLTADSTYIGTTTAGDSYGSQTSGATISGQFNLSNTPTNTAAGFCVPMLWSGGTQFRLVIVRQDTTHIQHMSSINFPMNQAIAFEGWIQVPISGWGR